jgi:hypothetical protein
LRPLENGELVRWMPGTSWWYDTSDLSPRYGGSIARKWKR